MLIQSVQNERIKHVIALREKKRLRHDEGVFVVEGAREAERALACGYRLREVFHFSGLGSLTDVLKKASAGVDFFDVTRAVFEKMAVRESSDGVICIFEVKQPSIADITVHPNFIALVFEGMEKPGNLGAVLRSADGAGVDAVFVVGESVDLFNPNAIRASLGAVFSVPVYSLRQDQLTAFLKTHAVQTFVATPDGAAIYSDETYRGPCAFVFGNEAKGVSDVWLRGPYKRIKIPMAGIADSLNVSVSAAIVMYEARRQLSLGR